MNTLAACNQPFDIPRGAPAAARTALALMRRLRHGSLTLQLPDGSTLRLGEAGALPHGNLVLRNWKVCAAALKRGDIGFAQSYIDGDWTTPDLTDLLKVLIANRQELESVIYGHWAGRWLDRLRHLLNRNTRTRSRRNIQAHYDLGNAFYALWLDPSMMYSSAWFEQGPEQPLAEAQQAKIDRALRATGVQPGERLLEIGCGWGALAQTAAADFGAQVTGVTLSAQQLAYGQARLQAAGLSQQAQLRLQDYRDIGDEPFDAICSIEMVEAVGREYWPQYFAALARLLKSGGRACIQSIVIDDALWDRYVRGTDFIQQYIFPGGCLPCPREFHRHAQAAGLRVQACFAFGADYARTLEQWRAAFLAQRNEVLALGFDAPFLRTWEFYLAYCEAGFAQGSLDVVQYTLEKP